jgi:hypothetical protein
MLSATAACSSAPGWIASWPGRLQATRCSMSGAVPESPSPATSWSGIAAYAGSTFAEPMLAMARTRFPEARWINADMRDLDLGESFAGLIAWDSFFHLSPDEQRSTIPRLARHVAPGGCLLLTVGPSASERIGSVGGEPVYHASLSIDEYEERLRGSWPGGRGFRSGGSRLRWAIGTVCRQAQTYFFASFSSASATSLRPMAKAFAYSRPIARA